MAPKQTDLAPLEHAIDQWAASPHARKLARRVVRAQAALQRLVSRRAWAAYLLVEEAVGARELALSDATVVLAFGPRSTRARNEDGGFCVSVEVPAGRPRATQRCRSVGSVE